jgi:hypothetical protein
MNYGSNGQSNGQNYNSNQNSRNSKANEPAERSGGPGNPFLEIYNDFQRSRDQAMAISSNVDS